MSDTLIRTLLIEDNPGDAELVRTYLADEPDVRVELTHADRFTRGLTCWAPPPPTSCSWT